MSLIEGPSTKSQAKKSYDKDYEEEPDIKAIAIIKPSHSDKKLIENLLNIVSTSDKEALSKQKTIILYSPYVEAEYIESYAVTGAHNNYLKEIPDDAKFSTVDEENRKILNIRENWKEIIEWIINVRKRKKRESEQ